MSGKITLIRVRRIPGDNINQELQWLGNSLGLFNLRDRDSSCFRIFITLVRRSPGQKGLSSDEIADLLHLSRGTVIHHLTRLMESGIVVREGGGYLLREGRLQDMISDLHRDVETMFAELRKVAEEIDERMG